MQDYLRDARHNQKSRVCKMFAAATSNALASRKVAHIKVTDQEKVDCPTVRPGAFDPLTHPNSHAASLQVALILLMPPLFGDLSEFWGADLRV